MATLTIDQRTALMNACHRAGEQHFTAYPVDANEPLDNDAIMMLAAGVLRFYDADVDLLPYLDGAAQEFRKGFVQAGGLVL